MDEVITGRMLFSPHADVSVNDTRQPLSISRTTCLLIFVSIGQCSEPSPFPCHLRDVPSR